MMNILKNKRILIFLRSFEIGGAERQAVMLANYLKREEKVKVAVWAYSPPGPILKLLDKGISYKSIPFDLESQKPGNEKMRKRGLWKLAIRIFLFRPDIIMPLTITPNVDCGYVWRWTGAKGCIWNQRDEFFNFLDKEIENFGFHNALVYISNSKKGKQLIEENLKDKKKPVYHISNAVKISPAKKEGRQWRADLGIDADSFVAVMIANLHENKDHENLIKAWKIVINEIGGANKPTLILAGRFDGTQDKLKELANNLGISEQVIFPGFTDDIAGIIRASDLGVFSSKKEGCPNGVLECMAAGLPVVATDIMGTREALGNDYSFCVPISNPREFADKILELMDNEALRKEIGLKNFRRIKEFFSPNTCFRKYGDVLKGIISHNK